MAGHNKIDTIEYDARIRVVQEYILMDYGKSDIVAQCVAKWGIKSRQAYNYINDAYEVFRKITEKDTEKRLSFHIQRRAKLLRDIDPAEKRTAQGTRAQLEILKDQAKLEQLYVEKIEHSGEVKTAISPKDIAAIADKIRANAKK